MHELERDLAEAKYPAHIHALFEKIVKGLYPELWEQAVKKRREFWDGLDG